MSNFDPASISFDPETRNQADFRSQLRFACELEFTASDTSGAPMKDSSGAPVIVTVPSADVPFVPWGILELEGHYLTVAVHATGPTLALHPNHYMIIEAAIGYSVGSIAEDAKDKSFAAGEIDGDAFTTSLFGYNNAVYIYTPKLITSKDELSAYFKQRGIEVRLRDLAYFEKKHNAANTPKPAA